MSVSIERGERAKACLADAAFRDQWEALYRACPWRTPFVGLPFVDAVLGTGEEALLVVERDAGGKLSGVLPLGWDGTWSALGGSAALEHAWLAPPLLGSYFMERATLELSRHLDDTQVDLGPIAPEAPVDWSDRPRRAGRFARVDYIRTSIIDIDPEAARRPLDKKANSTQLSALKKMGEIAVAFDPDLETVSTAMTWDDRRSTATAAEPKFAMASRRSVLRALAESGQILRAAMLLAGRIVAVFVGHRTDDRLVVELLAEDPELEQWAPAYLLWHMLEPELLARGVRRVDVTRGPQWLTWLGRAEDRARIQLLFAPRARMRFDAQAAVVGLSRWALQIVDRR